MKERKKLSYEEKKAMKRLEEELQIEELSKAEKKAIKKQNKTKRKVRRDNNKEFAIVTYSFVAVFLLLIGYMIYYNVFQAPSMITNAYNARQDTIGKNVVRGSILDKDGNALAYTEVADDGTETRVYPYSDLYSHVVGYSSYGKGGLESRVNSKLLTSNSNVFTKLKKELANEKQTGDNVITTLDTNLQQAASDALGDQKGAAVVMEPSTGKILAMVSKPTYDPNTLADNWESLNNSEDSVLLNRATKGLYVPGSTFKLVTALEYMRENPDYNNYWYECTGTIEHQGTSISCANGSVHGTINLGDSIAYSCNTSFSNIGLSLNVGSFLDTTEDLLFNKSLPGGFGASTSKVGLDKNASDADKMMTAMGQGKVQVSPYHMALITCSIANNGKLMEPYIIDKIENDNGSVIKETSSSAYRELMSSDEAATLKSFMTGVVDHGTATSLGRNGYDVAGKTGTAEYSSDKEKNHSWFVGFSNLDSPDIVVSVIIESSDGAASATNVAGQIFDAYYQ